MSEVILSKAYEDNVSKRIDSEYYRKKFLREDNQRKHYVNVSVGELAFVTDGQHGYHEVDENSDIYHLTAKNAKNWFADSIGADRIAKWVDDNNQRSSLKERDIILSTRGSVGYCALVTHNVLPANIDQDVARIALFNESSVNAEYLLTYLNSRFGQDWMLRNCSGMVQQGLPLAKVRDLPIPILEKIFQDKIQNTVQTAFQTIEKSKFTYTHAETLLLNSLGLADFSPSPEKINIKSFKDSFAATGRLDAEYFYPAKESALSFLEAMAGQTVGDLFISVRDLWQPEKADKDASVRNYDLTDALNPFLDSKKELTTCETIFSTKKRLQAGDLVVSRLRSYLKEVAVVLDGSEELMVGSTEFIVLRPKQKGLGVETLLVYLRSTLPQLIFKWSQDGSNHPRFDEKELLNLKVPDVLLVHEAQIANLIQQSFSLKAESERLLESAKRAVEIAIETNEQTAMV